MLPPARERLQAAIATGGMMASYLGELRDDEADGTFALMNSLHKSNQVLLANRHDVSVLKSCFNQPGALPWNIQF